MSAIKTYSPGKLVRYRDRRWIVLPSQDEEVTLLKPLGGSDHEITGVHRYLDFEGEQIEEDSFPLPTSSDIGAFETAKLLFDASRLSFRHASGPFRCMGKLSFRPRSYQIVPLVLALKQEVTRLLIADDVGIGKTVEALIILKELIERGEVRKFAIICPPHLCEQWQGELQDKLDIQAEIIRSSTAASLDRKLPDDKSIFFHVPYQVISIDYLKSDKRKALFLNDCPDLVIVDEAHTCALPAGSKTKAQQLRHSLLYDISQDPKKHMVLLTATPHSGKDEEFISLLNLLNREFGTYQFETIDQGQRRKIARYFIQRKRENIKRWLGEDTPFPERDAKEIPYQLSMDYQLFYEDVLKFARGITQDDGNKRSTRIRYWAALALLRGIMSSPQAGLEMLKNRQQRLLDDDEVEATQTMNNPVLFEDEGDSDFTQSELLDSAELNKEQIAELTRLSGVLDKIKGIQKDQKVARAAKQIKEWLKEGHQSIIFCKYIATAHYVGEVLKEALPKKVDIRVVTSELADEQRKEQVELMGRSEQRVMVATDCLSEGINLQEQFTAVLHYDLPWNPNRLEQREGRVDRFGQTGVPGADRNEVKAYLLWGEDNPIDSIVLKVLIRKVREIQRATGVSINIGEQGESIMDSVLKEVLLGHKTDSDSQQMSIFAEEHFTKELEAARAKAEKLRSIFAQDSVDREEIKKNLLEIDEAIGDVKTVESFVTRCMPILGCAIREDEAGYMLQTRNLPAHLKTFFPSKDQVKLSFDSPTPKGYRYIGRNHLFVEHLCQFMLSLAFDGHPNYNRVARVSEIQTDTVSTKTTLIMFRVRNVIKEVRGSREVVSEEMYLWGYEGSAGTSRFLDFNEAKNLLYSAVSLVDFPIDRQKADLERELGTFDQLQGQFLKLATARAEHLVEAHGRFKELVGGRRYEKATPILPPDVMGLYILMPKPKTI
jgi:superfamily II DNA or RNA helicase